MTLVVPLESLLDASAAGFKPDMLDCERLVIRQEATRAEESAARYLSARSRLRKLWRGLQLRYWIDQTAFPADAERYRKELGHDFGLIFAFRLSSAVWVNSVFGPGGERPVRVVDFDDFESIAFRRSREGTQRRLTRRLTDWRSLNWLENSERDIARSWTVVVCSPSDADEVRRRLSTTPLVVPNAVSFGAIAEQAASDHHEILFVGTLNYPPNADGLKWFVAMVWPRIMQELGASACLLVVGIDAPPELIDAISVPGVTYLGRVDDIAAVYARCDAAIVPILTGGGTRIKILEAFSFTRAVLTTPIGCEGIALTPGTEAMVASTPGDFAAKLASLIRDPVLRKSVAESGWRFGRANFSLDAVQAHALNSIRALAGKS
ncbi:MAG: glycosyltransferase [Alphaproteobacteria bacterium]|nr:glycosyltransferase [Alphaproteobacteria bacterium]